jgi:hypothetical protein
MTLRVIASGALAATPFALSACGGGGTSSKDVAKAAAKTLDSGRFSASYDASLAVATQKGTIDFKGAGSVDAKSHRSRLSVDLSSLAKESGATGDLSSFRGEEVVDSSREIVIYLRIPFYSEHLPPSKPWLRIDFGKTTREEGLAINSLTLEQDPAQYLEFLRAASGKVTKVGKEVAGGAETTRYRTSIFILQYPNTLTEARKTAAVRYAHRIVQLTGRSSFPTDVWLDGDGYVRRMTFTYAVPESSSTRAITYRVTLSYSRFGEGAAISLPPADEIARSNELQTG